MYQRHAAANTEYNRVHAFDWDGRLMHRRLVTSPQSLHLNGTCQTPGRSCLVVPATLQRSRVFCGQIKLTNSDDCQNRQGRCGTVDEHETPDQRCPRAKQ